MNSKVDTSRAKRKPDHDADAAAQEAPLTGAWPVRAWRTLRVRGAGTRAHAKQVLLAAATAALDKCIATLQWLRQHALEGEQAKEGADDENVGARHAARARNKAARGDEHADEAAAPKPRRRLRSAIVYLSVTLAGASLGTAIAHSTFKLLLDQRAADLKRQQSEIAKHSKSMAELKLKLDEQKTRRTEAETRLAEKEKALGELRQQRTEIQAKLSEALARRTSYARPADGGARRAPGGGGLNRTGDCNLEGGNIAATLSDCIAQMNRR